MKVAYVGAYESTYPRNRIIIDGLKQSGVEVVEHNLSLKGTKSTSFQSHRFLNVLLLMFRQIKHQALLAFTLLKLRGVDALVIGFPGYQDLPLTYIFTRLRRIPLVFDPLVSVHETIVEDRQLYRESSVFARLVLAVEKVLFRLPDLVIADTDIHAGYFSKIFGARKVVTSYVGASESFFNNSLPAQIKDALNPHFKVLFYGSYIPLHGIEHIIDAADLLRGEQISFEIIGTGQTFGLIEEKVKKLQLENVCLRGWASQAEIIEAVQSTNLCLGVFGMTPKANRVIPNKVFECLAAGKPVLTRDSDAAREVLKDGVNVFLCEPGSKRAIAEKILTIRESVELTKSVSAAGAQLSRDRFSPKSIGASVLEAMNNLRAA